ncbi:pyrimidine dimer DNA glycosylase/endonuclease V [Brachybacterium sp. NPDC056505]|uniref:pyrimidine dimer DNA glycosylase/endonuclease V n=1 Tax=Brachybacterium sp. NPDC056505 TaxID=3345843 RepID=UPI00366B7F65
MRLWSLHPSLLDRAALIAGWRETLLAQKVLAGGTKGYTRHPQLTRFRAHPEPLDAIGAYLVGLREEATARGYRFDATRILQPGDPSALHGITPIPVTTGQLEYELAHLRRKCEGRSPEWLERLPADGEVPAAHPLLTTVPGDVEAWEVR